MTEFTSTLVLLNLLPFVPQPFMSPAGVMLLRLWLPAAHMLLCDGVKRTVAALNELLWINTRSFFGLRCEILHIVVL